MINFLLKGLLRDHSRSLFPLITVSAGVMLMVFLYCWLNGAKSAMIQTTAHCSTGHLRVMSRAYAEEADQIPNDLALMGIDTLLLELQNSYPELLWTPRIKFAGLIDIPDKNGVTLTQGPVNGLAINILSPASPEWKLLNIKNALVQGNLPRKPGEILIGDDFSNQLNVQPGQTATLITSTIYGSMAMENFTIVGTIHFGITAMDRMAMITDLSDIQLLLDMPVGAGEILGFFHDDIYQNDRAEAITASFNNKYKKSRDEFTPVMETLYNQSDLSEYLKMIDLFSNIIVAVFLLAMSIVLWNAGLMSSLRRYGEIGVRLAIGEEKGHIYRSLLIESLMIGLGGSILGTLAGVGVSYYLQVKGLDISYMMKNATMMISNIMRAKVTPLSFVIGLLPGLLATFLGSAISGIGIYKRETAQLFKELEV
jgi:putative ABC transport system permease protein